MEKEVSQRRFPRSDDWPSTRLKKARIAAGYASGRAAAIAHEWVIGTYYTDETGRNPMSPKRVAQYALAFGVPSAWLLTGELAPDTPADQADRARQLDNLRYKDVAANMVGLSGESPAAAGAGIRLRKAREDAGFASARAAAKHFGWGVSTYQSHESGLSNLHSTKARLYGAAFGADPVWILSGKAAEGHDGAGRPTGGSRADPVEVLRLAESLHVGEVTNVGDAARFASNPEQATLRALAGTLARGGFAGRLAVLTVSVAPDGCRARAGDQILVDTGCQTPESGWLAETDARGDVSILPAAEHRRSAGKAIGRVVLVLVGAD